DDQVATLVRAERLAVAAADLGHDAGEGQGGGTGFRGHGARERSDHDAARLGLPPRVDDGAALLPEDAVVPHPRLRVDRLADGAEQPERREVVPARPLLAPL